MAFASFVVVFGNLIERWMVYHVGHEIGPYILGLWTVLRWIIAALTSIAVIGLIYHHGVPRTQPWHRVLPGAVLATWCGSWRRVFFGFYLRRFATLRCHLWIGGDRDRAADLALPGIHGGADRRGVQFACAIRASCSAPTRRSRRQPSAGKREPARTMKDHDENAA